MSLSLDRPVPRLPSLASASVPSSRRWTRLSITTFVCLVGVYSYQALTNLNIPGDIDPQYWVFRDFRDAIYYPVVAFIQGNNPYDLAAYYRTYPVGQVFPPYSPMTLLLHLPLGFLPFQAAEAVYYVLTVVLTVALARLTLQVCGLHVTTARIFGLATLIFLSPPGKRTLLFGQYTMQVVIGTYLALHYARRRPWLAAAGLALTTIKPTFGMPLAALMLARRDVRVVVIGLAIGGVLALVPTAILVHAAGGVGAFLASLNSSFVGFETDPTSNILLSAFRVDAVALIGHLLGWPRGTVGEAALGILILGVGLLGVHRLAVARDDGRVRLLSSALMCVTLLACTHHQSYDLLVLVAPLVGLAASPWAPRETARPAVRGLLLALLAFPFVNYLTSYTAMAWFDFSGDSWLAVTSLNSSAVLGALLVYLVLAFHGLRGEAARPPSDPPFARGEATFRPPYQGGPQGVGGTLRAAEAWPARLPWSRGAAVWMGLGFACVVTLLSYRATMNLNVPGNPNGPRWALQDFRDVIYYPVVSFLAGNNPYDAAMYLRTYPVRSSFPLYAPLTLIIHLPFGLLHYQWAELLYYVLTLALTLVLAYLTLRSCGFTTPVASVFGVGALILLSRPGQMNLLAGQNVATVVIGVYAALYFARSRPWLAALGLALCVLKPTVGLPLAVLMLCRREGRPVLIGLTIAGLVSALAAAVLMHAAGGARPFLASLGTNSSAFWANPANQEAASISRVDALALLGRLVGGALGNTWDVIIGAGIFSLGALAVRRLARNEVPIPPRRPQEKGPPPYQGGGRGGSEGGREDLHPNESARQLSTTLVCLTVLLCTYHQVYDALLLTLPLAGLAADRWTPGAAEQPVVRWALLALLTIPAVNYLTSATGIAALGISGVWWTAVTSLNGSALLAALGMCLVLAFRRRGPAVADGARA